MSGRFCAGWSADGVERGQVLCKPGTVKPHKKFKAEAYILTKEEGGRHTPFFTNYRPQFYFRTTDVTGVVQLPQGTEMVMPGDNVTMDVELITPIAMEGELASPSAKGGRTVGAASCTNRRIGNVRPAGFPAASLTGSEDAENQYPDPAQGVRPSHSRYVDAGDREYGKANWGAGARTRAAADAHRAVHGESLPACRQEKPRAVRDADAPPPSGHCRSTPQTVDALMKLDLAAGVDVEIKL